MKRFLSILALSAMVVGSMGYAPVHADDDDGTGGVIVHAVTVPFRLVGGALTGTYGFFKGGFKGAYETSAEANEKIVEAGTTPAQVLVWPFTAPVGFVKGGVTGFAEEFPTGYTFGDNTETQYPEYE